MQIIKVIVVFTYNCHLAMVTTITSRDEAFTLSDLPSKIPRKNIFMVKFIVILHSCNCGTVIQYRCLSSTVCSSCCCCCRCAVIFVRCLRLSSVLSWPLSCCRHSFVAAVVAIVDRMLSSWHPCCCQDPHCHVTCLSVVGIVIGVGLVHSCVGVGE